MIEPNNDNLIRLLMTALATVTASSCEDKSDIVPTMNTCINASVEIIEANANTNTEINVTELRDILTGLINEYNNSQQTTQSTTTNNNYY
jgi:hypothetical protein